MSRVFNPWLPLWKLSFLWAVLLLAAAADAADPARSHLISAEWLLQRLEIDEVRVLERALASLHRRGHKPATAFNGMAWHPRGATPLHRVSGSGRHADTPRRARATEEEIAPSRQRRLRSTDVQARRFMAVEHMPHHRCLRKTMTSEGGQHRIQALCRA